MVTECGERDIFPTVVPESAADAAGKLVCPRRWGLAPTTTRRHAKKRRRVRLPVNGARRGAVRRARPSSPWAAAGGHDDDHSRRFAQRGASVLLLGALRLAPTVAAADEGGVSFWVPGFFGSLAAAPQQPGRSLATLYYHTRVSAGADVAFARQVTRGNITANFSGNLNANLNANADLAIGDSELRVRDAGTGRPGRGGADRAVSAATMSPWTRR